MRSYLGNIYTLVMLQITLHNALSALLNMREFDVCIVYVYLVGIHAGYVNVCALLYSWGVDLSGDRCNENSEKSIAAAQGCESRLRSPKRSFISKTASVLKKPYTWIKALGSKLN